MINTIAGENNFNKEVETLKKKIKQAFYNCKENV